MLPCPICIAVLLQMQPCTEPWCTGVKVLQKMPVKSLVKTLRAQINHVLGAIKNIVS